MINKIIFPTLLLTFLITDISYAQNITPIHQGMKGVANSQCIKAVEFVEKEMFKKRPIRTHPIVNNKSPKQHPFVSTTIMNYNGDDSQITITATSGKNSSCDVVYAEIFTYNEPCSIARENIFKKWTFLGKMYETMIFNFRRDEELYGYLTPQANNATCLISKRKVFYK